MKIRLTTGRRSRFANIPDFSRLDHGADWFQVATIVTPPTKAAISLREMKADSTTIMIPLFLVLPAFISRSEMATVPTFVAGYDLKAMIE